MNYTLVCSFALIFIFITLIFINKNKYNHIEAFSDDNIRIIELPEDSLCSLYSSQPKELNDKCGSLTEKNCNSTSCCLWLNGSSCVAGNVNGPTFRSKNGKDIDVKYYSYKNKLTGKI